MSLASAVASACDRARPRSIRDRTRRREAPASAAAASTDEERDRAPGNATLPPTVNLAPIWFNQWMSQSWEAAPRAHGRRARWRERGARVTLFDPSHPREKPCGGGVTGRALALVAGAIDTAALAASLRKRVRRRPLCRMRAQTPPVRVDAARPWRLAAQRARRRQSRRCSIARCSTRPCAPGCAHVADARARRARRAHRRASADRRRRGHARRCRHRRRRRQQPRPPAPVARRSIAPDLSIAAGFFVHGATLDDHRHRLQHGPRRAISGRFRATIIWRSARARKPTPARPTRCAPLTLGWLRSGPGSARRDLERYAWPIPSLAGDAASTGAARGSALDARRRCRGPGRSDHARRASTSRLQSGALAADALRPAAMSRRAIAWRSRDDDAPGAGARRAAQGRLLPRAASFGWRWTAWPRARACARSWPISSPAVQPYRTLRGDC